MYWITNKHEFRSLIFLQHFCQSTVSGYDIPTFAKCDEPSSIFRTCSAKICLLITYLTFLKLICSSLFQYKLFRTTISLCIQIELLRTCNYVFTKTLFLHFPWLNSTGSFFLKFGLAPSIHFFPRCFIYLFKIAPQRITQHPLLP